MDKKQILISFSSHMFNEIITPLIFDFKKIYNITVTTYDLGMPKQLKNELMAMKEKGLIRDYFIIPSKNILNQYTFLKRNLNKINNVDYDFWLTHQEFQTFEQFIQYYVLPKDCKKIVLGHGISSLFCDHTNIAKELLSFKKDTLGNFKKVSKSNISVYKRILNKAQNLGGIFKLISSIPRIIVSKIIINFTKTYKRIKNFNSRYLIPIIYFGKVFKNEYYDDITQLGCGRSDYYLFCDDLEAKAHSNLYGSSKVKVVDYPTNNNCHCNSKEGNNYIISPLSGVVGVDEISDKQLKLFLRDFLLTAKEVGENMVLHLRKHPRETGKWPFQLRDYLRQNKLNAEVVGTEKPIRELMCDYRGMVGLSSCALRDARFCCKNAFIIAFEAVSMFRYPDPKFIYGNGEGIGWIDYDGKYNPNIFKNKKFIPPKRKTIPEFLNSV